MSHPLGSSNLNLASWIGNFELDVVVENAPFAAQVERMYEEDLANSTELVLSATPRRRVQHAQPHSQARGRAAQRATRTRQATAGAIRLGHTVGAALTSRRTLEPTDARSVALGGAAALALGVVVAVWPWIVALPLVFIAAWIRSALLVKAFGLVRLRRAAAAAAVRASSAPPAMTAIMVVRLDLLDEEQAKAPTPRHQSWWSDHRSW